MKKDTTKYFNNFIVKMFFFCIKQFGRYPFWIFYTLKYSFKTFLEILQSSILFFQLVELCFSTNSYQLLHVKIFFLSCLNWCVQLLETILIKNGRGLFINNVTVLGGGGEGVWEFVPKTVILLQNPSNSVIWGRGSWSPIFLWHHLWMKPR